MRYAINLSGGLDSTTSLYKFLVENPSETILIHHLQKIDNSPRTILEYKSVLNIIQLLHLDFTGRFSFEISTYIKPSMGGLSLLDTVLTSLYISRFLKPYNIEVILKSVPLEEFTRLGNVEYERRLNQQKNLLSAITERDLVFVNVLEGMSKKEIYDYLPIRYRELTISCRYPQKNGKNCNYCHTCKHLKTLENKQ